MIKAAHWKDCEWDLGRWPNFSPRELAQRGAGWEEGRTPIIIEESALDKLQALRDMCGFALPVTSAYRSPVYNAKVSTTGLNGPHTTGRAFDIAVYGERASYVIEYGYKCGFTGLGVHQRGSHSARFVHWDDLAKRIWSY